MLRIRYSLAAFLLAIIAINGPAWAQGTPQTITAKRIDVVQVTTGYRASKIQGASVYNIRKEAEAISETRRMTKSGKKELIHAFDAVDVVLRTHDAGLLVAANAALRSAAETTAIMEST